MQGPGESSTGRSRREGVRCQVRKDLHQPARRRLGACYRQDLFGGILGANQDGLSMEKLQREGLYIKKNDDK